MIMFTYVVFVFVLAASGVSTFEMSTSDQFVYTYFPLNTTTLKFRVKANSDAHIIFTDTSPPNTDSNSFLEIVIGGWENTKSVMRRSRTGVAEVSTLTPGIISNMEFRGFWVKLIGSGGIMVGKEKESVPFLSWTDPSPLRMVNFGVSTGFGSSGQWDIDTSGSGVLDDLSCAPGDVLLVRSPWDGSLLHVVKEACYTALTDHSCHATRKTYTITQETKTWDEAKAACEARGQRLATVKDEEEQAELEEEMKRHKDSYSEVWIAANDRQKNEEFIWYGGSNELVAYNNWQNKKLPKRADTKENCVYASALAFVLKNRAYWFLGDCDTRWHYACENIS